MCLTQKFINSTAAILLSYLIIFNSYQKQAFHTTGDIKNGNTKIFDATFSTDSTLIWNVQALYGISAAGLNNAIADAKVHFSTNPNDSIILDIASGTYNLNAQVNLKI